MIQHSYINLYGEIVKTLCVNNPEIVKDKINLIFDNILKNDMVVENYDDLCELNKYGDRLIGFTLILHYFENENIIKDMVDKIVVHIINLLDNKIDERFCNRMLCCICKISEMKQLNESVKSKLVLLKDNVSIKNKFKIMDILKE